MHPVLATPSWSYSVVTLHGSQPVAALVVSSGNISFPAEQGMHWESSDSSLYVFSAQAWQVLSV
jgi:hypothetical protein